jgi:hypothetical protein
VRWSPGDVVVQRSVFNGVIVFARPQRVVTHTDELLASTIAIGTEYYGILPTSRESAFDELASGELRWGLKAWDTHNVLELVRPGDAYSVLGFWNESATFVAWYINLQEPLRFTKIGYDTLDHTLDIIVGEDLASWLWKDEHELERAVGIGLHSADEADQIRANGEAVIAMIERGDAWWASWRSFMPEVSLPLPSLPDGWDVV